MFISGKKNTVGDQSAYSDIDECTMNNGGCEQNCNNTEGSFNCFCDSGYIVDSNGFNCSGEFIFHSCNLCIILLTDNNECSVNNGDCEHICTNTKGNFSCSCNTGYSLDDNERNCTG